MNQRGSTAALTWSRWAGAPAFITGGRADWQGNAGPHLPYWYNRYSLGWTHAALTCASPAADRMCFAHLAISNRCTMDLLA